MSKEDYFKAYIDIHTSPEKIAKFFIAKGSLLTENDLKNANASKIFKEWLKNMLDSKSI